MNTDLIYVVNPADMLSLVPQKDGDYPNFTMPGQAFPSTSEMKASVSPLGAISAGTLLAGSITGLPLGLIVAAVAARPILAGRIAKAKLDATIKIDEVEKSELEEFMRNHAVTVDMARGAELSFPPGHPRVGVAYKRHPLADIPGSGKEKVYIPCDKYDSLLMEEREAELLKMLVHLGATKVSITRTTARSNSMTMSAELSVKAKVAEGAIAGAASADSTNTFADTREFVLSGKPWRQGDKLETTRFAWVHFEPSWEALVVARELGGCLKAGLEIRENTSYSSNKELTATVQGLMYGGKLATDVQCSVDEEKVYFVQAEFGPFVS